MPYCHFERSRDISRCSFAMRDFSTSVGMAQ